MTSYDVYVTVLDLCLIATIDLSTVVPSTSVLYTIGDSADVQTFNFANVIVSESSCNKAIIYDVIYTDGSTLSDPFIFDSAAGTLSTYSNDPGIHKDYTLKLTAKFTGAEYTDIAEVS